jgi:hypothetical protein
LAFLKVSSVNEHDITNFFKQYVWGFMIGNVEVAKNDNLNFLVALGLSSYTEIMGGLVTGLLRTKNNGGKNYRSFLPYLGRYYVDLDQRIDLYSRVRCGLAHEYFIKGSGMVVKSLVDKNKQLETNKGILYVDSGQPNSFTGNEGTFSLPGDTVIFAIENYLRDFTAGTYSFHDALVAEFQKRADQRPLVRAFENSLK